MILMDDNFASIVNGVEEARLIFDNLKEVYRLHPHLQHSRDRAPSWSTSPSASLCPSPPCSSSASISVPTWFPPSSLAYEEKGVRHHGQASP